MKQVIPGAALSLLILVGQADAVVFMGLGHLSGDSNFSIANGVSENGVVVGTDWLASGDAEAFRWTFSDGMTGLGDLPGGRFYSSAFGVSADGQVIVGAGNSPLGAEAYRWTADEGMVGLGDFHGGIDNSGAFAVSSDGAVVVGRSSSALSGPGGEAFRWTEATGIVPLGDLPGGAYFSQARGVSADGSVVAGKSSSDLHDIAHEVFRWTEAAGMEGLGEFGEAFDVSADGSVVVGGTDSQAFRWTEADGVVGLGFLGDTNQASEAYGVSADGSVIVGESGTSSGGGAFVWDAENGMQSIEDILTLSGVDLGGWILASARGVSPDGSLIVGYGESPTGEREAWIVSLTDSIPVPTDPGPSIESTKEDMLLVDADGDGRADPGDTVRYSITISNFGTADAEELAFLDTPDLNSSLLVGSATTTQGLVLMGNGASDDFVEVDIGTLSQEGGSAEVTFDVLVIDPFPLGVLMIANQGEVSGGNFNLVFTDDPSTPAFPDTTMTQVANTDFDRCERELDEALEELDQCLSTPPFQDADADGEHDRTDRCPGTGPGTAVDDSGCSLDQYCAGIDANAENGKKTCKKSDWQNDEPLGKPEDCQAEKVIKGSSIYQCVPR